MSSPTPGTPGCCAFYLNRKAGKELTEVERSFADELRGKGMPVFDRGTPEDAAHFIREVLDQGVHTLIVSGGDGTLNVVLNACCRIAPERAWPRIALLPGGTTNLLSRRLHLPRLDRHVALLREMDLSATQLPTIEVRTLRLGDRLGLLCGVGYIERASSQFTSGDDGRDVDLTLWAATGILRATFGLGRVSWLEGGLDKAPLSASGEPIRLPGGGLPSGGVFTAEPRVSAVWEHPDLASLDGIHSMLSGGPSGRMLRHGVQGVTRARRRSPLIRVEIDDALTLPAGQRVMLDGEYIHLDSDTPLLPGPRFQVLHPTLPIGDPMRIMSLHRNS